jgi:thioredoxin 1
MFKKILGNAYRFHAVKDMAELNKLLPTIKTPYVLDFTASWCGPCKMLWPVISKREAEANGKWTIVKIDVDLEELAEVVTAHQVAGVPTLAFYKDNQKIYQRSGFSDDAAFREL